MSNIQDEVTTLERYGSIWVLAKDYEELKFRQPTLSQALQVPEVKALVEASRPFSQMVIRNGIEVVCDLYASGVRYLRAILSKLENSIDR